MIAMRSSTFLLPLVLLGALSVLLCTAAPARDANAGLATAGVDRDVREQAKSIYALGNPVLEKFEDGDSGEPGRQMQESGPSGAPTLAPTVMPTPAPSFASFTTAPTSSPTSDSGFSRRDGGEDGSLADDDDTSNDNNGGNNDRGGSSATSGGLRPLPPSVALAAMAIVAATFAMSA